MMSEARSAIEKAGAVGHAAAQALVLDDAGIAGITRRRFRKTTNSEHDRPPSPNIVARQFDVSAIGKTNRVWAGDITYIPTSEGWLYLAVVIDLFSRRVIGWSMDTTLERSLVIDALNDAIRRRKQTRGTIFHSDRGIQYVSKDFRAILKRHRMKQSMSRKANCWDNAVVESFFGTMKNELEDPIWRSRADARAAIFEYITVWYNRKRRHSTLGYISPEQYESLLPIAA